MMGSDMPDGPIARVVCDSMHPTTGSRLTTMVVRMHRFVLAEFNTHRVFSRSSASSRAIPVGRRMEQFWEDPAWPISWPAERSGMQGGVELEGDDRSDAQLLFEQIHHDVGQAVEAYLAIRPDKIRRLHKSVINRLLEPFLWHEVIVASTEWENFFSQRCSSLAQPEIRVVAEAMREVLEASTPTELGFDDYHLPFITGAERGEWSVPRQMRISVARCARVSHLNHDGQYDPEADEALYRKLVTADPPHWAPLEMVARPAIEPRLNGNFGQGWLQLRHSAADRAHAGGDVDRLVGGGI